MYVKIEARIIDKGDGTKPSAWNNGLNWIMFRSMLSWDGVKKSTADEMHDVTRLYDDSATDLLGIWADEVHGSRDVVLDRTKYRVYVLGENGQTIDRLC
jgi:hypothetical protein